MGAKKTKSSSAGNIQVVHSGPVIGAVGARAGTADQDITAAEAAVVPLSVSSLK
jgi:uncharacterized protein GlcG (DUF336 family)